ncbi:hypothetical protein JR338_06540 [Chloroflexota bacterium]|nr:hypothetical protein JR338_06540 [Chloroflexota bacterium]
MKRRRLFQLLIGLLILFLLSGCVNLRQDMLVNQDGSALLHFALGVETESYEAFQEQIPDGMSLESLLATLMSDELVTEVTTDHYEDEGYTWDTVDLAVSDFAALLQTDRRIGMAVLAVDETDEGYYFSQVLDLQNTNLAIPGVNLMDLTGARYTVTLETPQILNTNGDQPEAGTAIWDVTVTDLLQGGDTIILTADYNLTPYEGNFIPVKLLFPYVVMGFLGIGGLAIVIVILLNTTKLGDKTRKLNFRR